MVYNIDKGGLTMTNLDRMKQNIITQIIAMDTETFRDFIDLFQEQYTKNKIIDCSEMFLCSDCKKLFGQCTDKDTDQFCIERFEKYANIVAK